MRPLMLHRSCDLGPILSVSAEIHATPIGCDVEFHLVGGVDAIRIPSAGPTARSDDLWQTTCFEFFWQPIGGSSYREFNLSPSGRWAAYDFDEFRTGMRDAAVDAIAISQSCSSSHGHGELVLKASIAAELPTPAQVSLSAVVQHADGELQYWALAFGPGKADFHSEACRQLIIERD